ncbi:hypothetical protein AHiyo4_40040 [Arthrobacter sp. Hiyo4]|nr:hypothetical protein AHiyo4_40040 [Arthrobacter sp. Hiyo4]
MQLKSSESVYEARLQAIAFDPAFDPNVLILKGRQNNSLINKPDEIRTATAQVIESARRFCLAVQVLVLGPSAPQPLVAEVHTAQPVLGTHS